jgi:hypothetical protein
MKYLHKFRFEVLERRTLLAGHGDFNGDGFDDLAVGALQENVGSVQGAGAVRVIYGAAQGLKSTNNQTWTQDSPGVNGTAALFDAFGTALAIGDFNDDGFDDLAIGVVGETVSGKNSAGGVNVLYGSKNGLTASNDQLWTQDSPGINGEAEAFDFVGFALTTGDFDGDGFDDLAIGVENESVGSISTAGAVMVIYGSSAGLSSAGDQYWTQDSSGINDTAETTDEFGSALAAGDFNRDGRDDLAIGVHDEDVGSFGDAGAVNIIYGSQSGLTGSGDQFWTQNSPKVADSAEVDDVFGFALAAGDFNGDRFDDLAIGSPGEDSSGTVHVLNGSAAKLAGATTSFNQGTLGYTVPLGSEFGIALATGDFDRDGHADLVVGAYNEKVAMINAAGAVYVVQGSANGINNLDAQRWIQGAGPSGTLAGSPEIGDFFGLAVATGDYDGDGRSDLAIGVVGDAPGNLDRAGGVHVLYSFHYGLFDLSNQYWHQGLLSSSDGNEAGDEFGSALA